MYTMWYSTLKLRETRKQQTKEQIFTKTLDNNDGSYVMPNMTEQTLQKLQRQHIVVKNQCCCNETDRLDSSR